MPYGCFDKLSTSMHFEKRALKTRSLWIVVRRIQNAKDTKKNLQKNRFLQNNTIITMTQILPNHEYSPLQAKPANNRSKIILYIIIAVVAGMVTGGFVPDIAVKFSLLGEIFINALMMLVIPIVILSLIVGITNLGDLRSLGTLGWRTIVYYMTTTGIAVLLGIALVNIIQPGKGLSTGENHPDVSYTIQENNPYVIQVKENEWRKKSYNDKYRATLLDKGIQGTIHSVSGNLIG